MFRAPRVLKTHATAPPAGAAVSSSGNGALITCSMVKVGCCPASAAGPSKARVRQRSKLVIGRSASPQLNRVVRQSSQPVPESSASIAVVRPTTHPQPRVNWGTRATIPKPTNVAVAPPTRIQSSDERRPGRSEEHTSELQSQSNLVCRLLLEKKKEKLATELQSGEHML